MSRGHQRAHLRAPIRGAVLYADGGHVHRAAGLNLSEGGCLLTEIPVFPDAETTIMLSLPQLPLFKNFSLLKLRTFGADMFPARVVRAYGQLVRTSEDENALDAVFRPRVGLHFTTVAASDRRAIAEYVETFAGNLVYLQMLLDGWNTSDEHRARTLALAGLLGYGDIPKVSELRARMRTDYLSLQWV